MITRQFICTFKFCTRQLSKSVQLYALITRSGSQYSKFINSELNSSPQKTMSIFKFSDYDCIGFDLDSTIISYNSTNLLKLEYEIITNFLINKKGYDLKSLRKPLTDQDLEFLQKGLFFDFEKGNIVKLTCDGNVHCASHGTKFLSAEEIEIYYPNRKWELGSLFSKDPLMTWNGPLSLKIRTLLDCFDMPAGLIFAKAVDSLDEANGKPLSNYNIWPDILEAFADMYERQQLRNNAGYFFPALKNNPDKYIHKCNSNLVKWLQKIKEKKKIFLITGSNSDFVEVTASYALGENWKSLFDIMICYAKKPGFFTDKRPFYSLKDNFEDKIVTSKDLEIGQIYNQGNWEELLEFFSQIVGKNNPKCLYVGDNLLQDIYAASISKNCDTIVISDEQLAEGMLQQDFSHIHKDIYASKAWGSYFYLNDSDGFKDSIWNHLIKKFSKMCIPKLEIISNKPLDEPFKCFTQEDTDKELNGYHPAKPITIQ